MAMTGTVLFFDPVGGLGWIKAEDGGIYRTGRTEILGPIPQPGERVTFQVRASHWRRSDAIQVRPVHEKPING